MKITINLIKAHNTLGINFYSGTMKLSDLFENFEVPVYRANSSDITRPDSGYQREATPARIDLAKNRVINPIPGTSIPNTELFVDCINLNLRAEDAENYVQPFVKGKDDFGDFFKFYYTQSLGKFMFVDGQTRFRGAYRAWSEARESKDYDLANKIAELKVGIFLTFCKDQYKEAYIFYLINQYSKAISPDGASRLLLEGSKKNDINFVNEITRAKKGQEISSMAIAEELSINSNVWANNVKDFNAQAGDRQKISIKAFARIINFLLKEVKANSNSAKISPEKATYNIVEAFWEGLAISYPEMFKPATKERYNILKAGPAEILMRLLVKMYTLSINGNTFGSLTDPKTFKNILKPVLDAHTDKNADGNNVSGARLFLTGKTGAMGKYSNNAAKAEKATDIQREVFDHLGIPRP